jgi:hypothetical protein
MGTSLPAGLLARPQRGAVEIAALFSLYGLYELVRGYGEASASVALHNAKEIVTLERGLGVYVERGVQELAELVPGLPGLLGLAYITLHFLGTTAALIWVYRRHRESFPLVRNTLIASTAVSLVVYILFPVAPPRLAGLGFADTVTHHAGINLSSDLLGSLYNPYAAVPSLHFGYALLVGMVLVNLGGHRWLRLTGYAYPVAMLAIIIATGNHFVLDAAAGGLAVAIGWTVARRLEPTGSRPPRATAGVCA